MVAELASARHMPTATLFDDIARAGGLLAYGRNLNGTFRQVGTMVGKILQGSRVADLPVERPTNVVGWQFGWQLRPHSKHCFSQVAY